MSKSFRRACVAVVVCVTASLAGWASFVTPSGPLRGAQAVPSGALAVEDDMHEFMEYAFQPAYLRLKDVIAAEPSNSAGWKPIKADSLILAEGGNLLLLRKPQDDPDAWTTHAVAVRDEGARLYAAAKKRDFRTSRRAYETMLKRCNACHDQFAAGEHQLEP